MIKKTKASAKTRLSSGKEPLFEEPSTVSTSCSQGTPQRPQTSPYTSSPVALYIGPEQRVYYVPQHFLQNPEQIDSVPRAGRLHLPDVDENTGHVLIHYLYTGAYQTLNNIDASLIDGVNTEFKRAILAYVAAEKYKLQNLQQLAKHQIEHFSAKMNIFDIVDAIKEDFSKLPGDSTWFHDYLVGKAKSAFEEDHTIFARDDFFDRINDGALGRLLVKYVVGFYNDKVLRMLNAERVPVPQISGECIPDAQDLFIEKVQVDESFAIKETSAEDCIIEAGPTEVYPEEAYRIEECPAAECPAAECPVEEFPAEACPAEECPAEEYPMEECPTEEYPMEECPVEECPAEEYPMEECPVEECPAEEYPVEECPAEEYPMEECPAEEYLVEEYPVEECPAEECPAEEWPVEECPDQEELEAPPYSRSFLSNKDRKMQKKRGATIIQEALAPPEPELEQVIEAEDGICPVRARHLLEGDMWKDCRLCRAVLRQVAIQIARKHHINEDGYEIVDRVLMG